jgi:hypothetical protein
MNRRHENLETKPDLVVDSELVRFIAKALAFDIEEDLLRRIVRRLVFNCEREIEFPVRMRLEHDVGSVSTAKVCVIDGVCDLQTAVPVSEQLKLQKKQGNTYSKVYAAEGDIEIIRIADTAVYLSIVNSWIRVDVRDVHEEVYLRTPFCRLNQCAVRWRCHAVDDNIRRANELLIEAKINALSKSMKLMYLPMPK